MKSSNLIIGLIVIAAFFFGGYIGYRFGDGERQNHVQQVRAPKAVVRSPEAFAPASARPSVPPREPKAEQARQLDGVPIGKRGDVFTNQAEKLLSYYKDPEVGTMLRMRDIRNHYGKTLLFFKHQDDLSSEQKRGLLELLADKTYGNMEAAPFIYTDPIQLGVITDTYDNEFRGGNFYLAGRRNCCPIF